MLDSTASDVVAGGDGVVAVVDGVVVGGFVVAGDLVSMVRK